LVLKASSLRFWHATIPLAVPFMALAYGYLRAGADIMERSSDVSREMVLVIQAIIILLVTAERFLPMVQRSIAARKDIKNGTTAAPALTRKED
jgi:general nucleoside transport system permease protein